MPSNQQRRDAAKRKLQRQLARRQQRAVAQRRRLMIVGVVAAVLVIAGGVWLFTSLGSGSDTATGSSGAGSADGAGTGSAAVTGTGTTDTAASDTTPSSDAPTSTGADTPCSYPASGTAAKPVQPPTNLSPADTGTVEATVTLNTGKLTFQLDRANAPCAVESFLSLASQQYFDGTPCHRLTTSATLKVLQCGDPSGTGTGGPGYSFADELTGNEQYTAGTLAMANSGPDTNGSQFFIVYGDSMLKPEYTVLGSVTQGLDVVKAIADKGAVKSGQPAQDGAPAEQVTIESVTIPAGAVDATAGESTGSSGTAGAGASTGASPSTTATR